MKKLKDEELMKINGGGFNIGIAAAIIGGISFLVGIFDGVVRPLKCR